jgi:hypothetical protein
MRIIAFIQDAHCHLAIAKRRRAIKDIMKSLGFGRELSRTAYLTSRLRLLSQNSSIPRTLWFDRLTTQQVT